MSTSLLALDPLVIPLVRGARILDLGCGYGHWGHLLATHYRSEARGPAWRAEVVGVDLHEGNVDLCRLSGAYETVHGGDVVEFLAGQQDGSFDTVLAVDIIEHMPKDRGKRLLTEAERVAAAMVIVSTPNFLNLREGAEGLTGFNEWERHVCSWTARELRERGYRVRGVNHNLRPRLYRIRGMVRLFSTFPFLHDCLDMMSARCVRIAHTLLAWRGSEDGRLRTEDGRLRTEE